MTNSSPTIADRFITMISAGVIGGGVTASLADVAGIEARVGELRGAVLSLLAPEGSIATETNPNFKGVAAPAPATPPSPASADWPSYNETLTSERFSDLSQINTKNVAKLKVLCTYAAPEASLSFLFWGAGLFVLPVIGALLPT